MKSIVKKHSSCYQKILSELRVARLVWTTNVRATMQNRIAFVLQVAGMMVSDLAFVIIWGLFFQAIGTVNGWGGWESLGLLAINTLSFGLAFSFGGGVIRLPKYIEDGALDGFLLSPRNVLWRIVTSRFDLPAFGDTLFGILLLAIFSIKMHLSVLAILLLVGCVIPATLVTLMIHLSTGCIAFYLQDAEGIAFSLFKTFVSPSMYPAGLFPGPVKFFFTFVIPSLLVGGLPIQIVQTESISLFLLLFGLSICWTIFGIVLFYFSLRRYESGNAIGLRG